LKLKPAMAPVLEGKSIWFRPKKTVLEGRRALDLENQE
jgi:hypothetical protein